MTTYAALIRRFVDRYPMIEDLDDGAQTCFYCDADGLLDDDLSALGAGDEAFYAVHLPGCPWMEAALMLPGFDYGKHRFESVEQTSQRHADQISLLRLPDPPTPLMLVVDLGDPE